MRLVLQCHRAIASGMELLVAFGHSPICIAPRTAMTTSDIPAATASYAISLESIREAAVRIEGLAHRTPVLTCSALDAAASANPDGMHVRLFFKCENLQKIGAFKFRGATNAVAKVLEGRGGVTTTSDGEPLTFLAHSSGNHAQAVAVAARDAGCKAVIVMPHNTPLVKQNAVRGYGAQIVFCGTSPTDRAAVAADWVARTGGVFIHPNDDPDVMSGQGTVALELMEQVQQQHGVQLDAVLAPVGGGGLCAATAMAVKSVNAAIKVFGIEPEGAADAYASFTSGTLQGHATPPNTVADGLRSSLGGNNFPVIRDHVDDIVVVNDDEIVAAMKLMWERMKLVVEPSGAVPVASVLTHKLPLRAMKAERGTNEVVNVGIIISGGNVDLDELPWISKK